MSEINEQSTSASETLTRGLPATLTALLLRAPGLLLLVFLITIAVFLPTLRNGFIDWQDRTDLLENTNYRGFSGAHMVWMFTSLHAGIYQPLTWLTFAIDYQLWELDPFGCHLTSLLIHGANAVLLLLVLNQLLSRNSSRIRAVETTCITALAVLLFSLHPLRVEPVAWAAARSQLLSTFFLLAAFYSYLRGVQCMSTAAYRGWLTLALIGQSFSILLGPMALRCLSSRFCSMFIRCADIPKLEWLAQLLYRPIFYLWKTILPVALAPVYELFDVSDLWPWTLIFGSVGLASVVVGVLSIWTRSISYLVIWLCYVTLVFVPTLGVGLDGNQVFADRYTYLPSLFLAGLAAAVLSQGLYLWKSREIHSTGLSTVLGAGLVVLLILSILSWEQTTAWRSAEKLWRHTVAVYPQSRQAREKLAEFLISQNKESEALWVYQHTAQINVGSAATQADLARVLASRGRLQEAQISYRRALEIDPNLRQALLGMGNILVSSGDFAGAVDQYRAALSRGQTASLHVNLGYALARLDKINEALEHYQKAIQLDSTNVNAYVNMGNVLAAQRRPKEAIENFRKALRLRFNHSRAHFALASVLSQTGSLKDAMDHYQHAINYDPEFADAYLKVALILADQGRLDTAVAYFRYALGIKPNFGDARLGLARTLAAQGKKQEALREYEEAKRLLQPHNNPASPG